MILWQCARCGTCWWSPAADGYPGPAARCLCERAPICRAGVWRTVMNRRLGAAGANLARGGNGVRRKIPADAVLGPRGDYWDACPICGSRKRVGAERCLTCYRARYTLVSV